MPEDAPSSRSHRVAEDSASRQAGDDGLSGAREASFLRGQQRVLEATATGVALPLVLEQIVRLIESQSDDMLCSILLVDRAKRVLRHGAAPRLPAAFSQAIDGVPIGPGQGSCGSAAFSGEVVEVEDIATHPFWVDYRGQALPHGLRACWSSPIMAPTGDVLGTFAMYYREPRLPNEVERHWVQAATHLAGIAIVADRSREVEAALHQSEAELRAVFDHAAIGIALVSSEGRFLRVNRALCHMLDYEAHEFRQLTVAALTHPEDLQQDLALASDVMAGTRESYQVDKRFLKKDGSIVWGRFTGSLVRGAEHVDGLQSRLRHPLEGLLGIGMIEDISAQKRLEAQVLRSQRLDGLARLAGGLAHDFNNLLTTIEGSVRLALDELEGDNSPNSMNDPVTPQPTRSALHDIHRATARASDLVRRLLAFSPDSEPQRTTRQIAPIASEVARLLGVKLPANVVVREELEKAPIWVRADATQLHQAVMNLATNAFQAMPEGGVLTLRLVLAEPAPSEAKSSGPWAVLSVSDSGVGIDPAHCEQVFEPFFTTQPPGQGVGLGLAIVQAIAAAHEGFVRLQSEVGRGSTFELWLPVVSAPEVTVVPSPVRVQPQPGATGVGPGRDEHILFVDDETIIVRLAKRELERAGFRATTFDDPEAAVAAFKRAPDTFDAIVTDASMPKLSGFDVAREVRLQRPLIPIIVISGGLWNRDSHDIERLGIGELLLKPHALQELAPTLRRLLDGLAPST